MGDICFSQVESVRILRKIKENKKRKVGPLVRTLGGCVCTYLFFICARVGVDCTLCLPCVPGTLLHLSEYHLRKCTSALSKVLSFAYRCMSY